ncbi:MAG: hypothetical protein IKN74_00430 [Clostridia bacterium]|nr:hypothetical protein [Clostridia bacterium]
MISEFINPLLFFVLANVTTTIILNKKFEKVLPITLLSVGLVLFISGLVFQTFNIGFLVCILYALYSVIYILKYKDEEKKITTVANNVVTNGLILFVTLYVLIFVFDLYRTLGVWDDFSHWGMMVKEMFRLDKFYSVNESNLMAHKDYPPFISLYELFWIKLTNMYNEATIVRAMHMLELSMIIPFININDDNKKKYQVVLTGVLFVTIFILLLNLIDHHKIINTAYVDYVMMLITLYGLLSIFYSEKLTSNFSIVNMFVVVLSLSLLKQISVCFCFMIIAYYFMMLIIRKKHELEEVNKKEIVSKIICISLLVIVIPIASIIIWKIYISQFNIDKQFVIKSETLETLNSRLNLNDIVLKKYIDFIINENVMNIKIDCSVLWASLVIYIIFFISAFRSKDKKNSIIYSILILLGNIAYLFVMLFTYLTLFSKIEAENLASFDRYVCSYLILPMYSLVIIFVNRLLKTDFKKQMLCMISLSVIFLLIGKEYTKNDLSFIAINKSENNYEFISEFVRDNYETSNIAIFSQIDHSVLVRYKVAYYLNDMKNVFKKVYAIYVPDKDDLDYGNIEDYYLRPQLHNYDYLYILDENDKLKEVLNTDERLFKVTYEDEKLNLINYSSK